MKKILVLGIGNRLMEDDGIGVRIAEELAMESDMQNVDFVVGETDVDFCLSKLLEADHCIIIDSAYLGNEPGTISVFPLKEIIEQKRSAMSFHDFDLIHAMTTENLLKEGLLITVEVSNINFSTELSSVMNERFRGILHDIKEILNEYKSSIILLS